MNTANQLVDGLQTISRQLADQGETLKVIQTQTILIAEHGLVGRCPYCKCLLPPEAPDKKPNAIPAAMPDDRSEELYKRYQAAIFLDKTEKEVYRLRKKGKLKFVPHENTSKIRYRHADLLVCYKEIWGCAKK